MSNNRLELKPVHKLVTDETYEFYIPAYQRGYRWGERQVEDLLKDIWEFATKTEKDRFYCLQPIVVKKRSEHAREVIDGQQRITTLKLISRYLDEASCEKFIIKYETRKNSEKFLKSIGKNENGENKSCENIDFYCMQKAYETVEDYLSDKSYEDKEKIKKVLFCPDTNQNVRFIWYEVDEECDPVDIFTRLNMGRIPLTNAELVKALLLQKDKLCGKEQETIELKQMQIAAEWDHIEQTLQDDSFWYFIWDGNTPPENRQFENRIEYILDLYVYFQRGQKEEESLSTFNYFAEKINNENVSTNSVWLDIKHFFMRIKEWYDNRELYHRIGFLISTQPDTLLLIKVLAEKAEKETKEGFKKFIHEKIKGVINTVNLEELSYHNGKSVRNILILFNIETIIRSKMHLRFPFDKFKKEKWDIEHVHSKTDNTFENITSTDRQKEWLEDNLKFLERSGLDKQNSNLKEKVEKYKSGLNEKKNNSDIFQEIYDELTKLTKLDELEPLENIDSLSNLALLNAAINRSYGNAPFPFKRITIIEKDKEGEFIPVCTKNLFLKYYSKKPGNPWYWSNDDAKAYIDAIKETLEAYLL